MCYKNNTMKLNQWVDDGWRDTRYALRSLARSRGFTAVALLTLSVGIGSATAIFSLANTVLLRPLPLVDAGRLVRIVEHDRPRNVPNMIWREYLDWQAQTKTLSGLAATSSDSQVIEAPAGLVRMTGGLVSANYFEVLGARAMLGRTLVARDASNPDVIVLGFYAWQRQFRSDPQTIGSVVEFRAGSLAGRAMTVVGVMPESMETIGSPMDFYAPIVAAAHPRSIGLGSLIGRLRDGLSLAAASEEANALGMAIRPPRPAAAPRLTRARFEAKNLNEGILDPPPGRLGGSGVATPRVTLRIFVGAVAIVLLIVCANVANLLLVRGTARRRELATRVALGASRGRLLRLILTECLILAGAGGVLGAALGAVGLSLIKRLLTIDAQGVFRIVFGENILPRSNEVGIDLRLFAIAFAVAGIATLAFGLLPALQLARTNQLEAMGSRGAGSARRETRLRMGLVVGQLAMATMLLVGAGLLATSFVNLATVDKGYNPARVLTFQLVLPREYPVARKVDSIEAVLRATRDVPEVDAAGFAYAGILIPIQNTVGSFVPPGRTLEAVSSEKDRPRLRSLSAGYLDAAGAQLLSGRLIGDGDSASAPPVAVINRTVQRRYFGDTNPVAAFMDWHGGRGPAVPVQVIGVIADIRQAALDKEPWPEVFMDYRQVIALQERWGAQPGTVDSLALGFMSFAMRTRGHPGRAIPSVRQAIARADPNAALDAIAPLDSVVGNSLARQRFYAVTLAGFACIAALLAAIGVYGVLAYAVVERTREIGLRMALGAGRRQVLGLVLGRGLLLAAIGIACGLAGAVAATRYLQAMLYGITPLDRGTFLVVAVAFAAVAALASYLPARRATKVDPIVALRTE
jgi:putative ABC transport system permease protein